jgi:hypothetical protein
MEKTQTRTFYCGGIKKLVGLWTKCTEKQVYYVEE